jgi:hypothetical protein
MLLASAIIALSQAAAPASDLGPDRLRRGRCLAVEVASKTPRAAQDRTPSFSAIRDHDLEIRAWLGDLSGPHVLYLKVYTPRGYLYQTFTVPFTPPDAGNEPEARRGRSGAPRRFALGATLPVTGTAIMTSGLYGRWRVEPWLDAGTGPCAAPVGFVIGE